MTTTLDIFGTRLRTGTTRRYVVIGLPPNSERPVILKRSDSLDAARYAAGRHGRMQVSVVDTTTGLAV
jgi:hypothetical protein